MKIFKSILEFQNTVGAESLGFVATMGALHDGHGALIERSKNENEKTCVSIFVNPTQFNNPEDFETYPNREEEDLKFCKDSGVDYVFMPPVTDIYSDEESIEFVEAEISSVCEGTHRPGHFAGVLTVVLKLLNIIKPTQAYFGEKDYQQLLLIQRMAKQFFLDSKIIGVKIFRDEKGLALSSRNYNLSEEGTLTAQKIANTFLQTKSKSEFLDKIENQVELEYYEEKWGRVLIAHYVEGVRLIDNKPLIERSGV